MERFRFNAKQSIHQIVNSAQFNVNKCVSKKKKKKKLQNIVLILRGISYLNNL